MAVYTVYSVREIIAKAYANRPSEHGRFYILCDRDIQLKVYRAWRQRLPRDVRKTIIVEPFDLKRFETLYQCEPYICIPTAYDEELAM